MSNKIAKTILKHDISVVEVDSFDSRSSWSVCDIRKLYPYISAFIIQPHKDAPINCEFNFNLHEDVVVVNYDSEYFTTLPSEEYKVHTIVIPGYYAEQLTAGIENKSEISNGVIFCKP